MARATLQNHHSRHGNLICCVKTYEIPSAKITFEFWAGQAASGLGLLRIAYKTNEILTVLQKYCSRCRPGTVIFKRLITLMKFECFCAGPGQLDE
jgi:hypothetical protein